MKIREWMNNNSAVVMAVAVVILIGALWFLVRTMQSPKAIVRPMWFYCLQEQRLFLAEPGSIAPIDSPWGGQAVQAIVDFCGDCDQEPRIRYLLQYTEQAKAEQEKQRKLMAEKGGKGTGFFMDPFMRGPGGQLISAVDQVEWINIMDPQAESLRGMMPECDDGSKPIYNCFPKRFNP